MQGFLVFANFFQRVWNKFSFSYLSYWCSAVLHESDGGIFLLVFTWQVAFLSGFLFKEKLLKNFHGKFWIWINLYFGICVFEILATKNPWPETQGQNFVSVSKDVFEFLFWAKSFERSFFQNNVFLMLICQLVGSDFSD
jgi:hypothetical protein